MTDQATTETRRAALLDRAFADGKGIEEALGLAARAEAFITGAIAPTAILGTQPALPPPAPAPAVERRISLKGHRIGKGARPLTDAGPKPGRETRKPGRTGIREPWSDADIAYLEQAWPAGVFIEEIMARLKGRSHGSIRVKVTFLGLKRSPEFRSIVNRMAAQKRHKRGAKRGPARMRAAGTPISIRPSLPSWTRSWLGSRSAARRFRRGIRPGTICFEETTLRRASSWPKRTPFAIAWASRCSPYPTATRHRPQAWEPPPGCWSRRRREPRCHRAWNTNTLLADLKGARGRPRQTKRPCAPVRPAGPLERGCEPCGQGARCRNTWLLAFSY